MSQERPLEPDWQAIFDDVLDHAEACRRWRLWCDEMASLGTLSEANGPALERLVVVSILFDRAARACLSEGHVVRPRKGNATGISRINPSLTSLAMLARVVASLEDQLGLAPGTRNRVGRVQKRTKWEELPAARYIKALRGEVVPIKGRKA